MDVVSVKQAELLSHKLIYSRTFQFFSGFFFVVLLPSLLMWKVEGVVSPDMIKLSSQAGVACVFSLSLVSLHKLMGFPEARKALYILPTVLAWYGGLVFFFFAFRFGYSVYYIFYSFLAALLFFYFTYFTVVRHVSYHIAYLPLGRAESHPELPGVRWIKLEHAEPLTTHVDAIMTDLHANIPEHWQRFLAVCTLQRIPVFHYKRLMESLTGRVKIEYVSENEFGSLQPSVVYCFIKRAADIVLALCLLPVLVPVFVVLTVLIRCDSKGPALFVQKRVGYGGRLFNMYKFRSMHVNGGGKCFTESSQDPRITKVGKVLRKYRLDELPQVLNVLKGEMSFIGPRPESCELSEWYEQDVPFFSYRHIVRPGISGWAQVKQGYAAELDGMKKKLEYDFFYIKNFSLWLDILIVYKTIRILFTGFGAR